MLPKFHIFEDRDVSNEKKKIENLFNVFTIFLASSDVLYWLQICFLSCVLIDIKWLDNLGPMGASLNITVNGCQAPRADVVHVLCGY